MFYFKEYLYRCMKKNFLTKKIYINFFINIAKNLIKIQIVKLTTIKKLYNHNK